MTAPASTTPFGPPDGSRHRLAKRIAMLIALLMPVAIAEISLRIIGFGDPAPNEARVRADGLPLFRYAPGSDPDEGLFRPTRAPMPKPPGRYRLALLGDSFTYGAGLADEETLARQLEGLLVGQGFDVDVVNLGIQGTNTQQQSLIAERYLPRYAPDLVLLVVVGNDTDNMPCNPDPAATCDVPLSLDERLDHFLLGHAYTYRPLHAALVRDGCLSPSRCTAIAGWERDTVRGRCFRRSLAHIRDTSRALGAPLLAMLYPYAQDPSQGHKDADSGPSAEEEALRRVFEQLEVVPMDVGAALKGQNYERMRLPDNHPSGASNRVVSAALVERLARWWHESGHHAPPVKVVQ